MWKLVAIALSLDLASACAVTDDRPETLGYITETILAPSCGTTTCHSALKRQSGYAFDSVEGARAAISDGGLIATCATPPCDGADADSYLLTVMTTQDRAGNRMPRDQPIANKDIVLIAHWIADGAEGYTP